MHISTDHYRALFYRDLSAAFLKEGTNSSFSNSFYQFFQTYPRTLNPLNRISRSATTFRPPHKNVRASLRRTITVLCTRARTVRIFTLFTFLLSAARPHNARARYTSETSFVSRAYQFETPRREYDVHTTTGDCCYSKETSDLTIPTLRLVFAIQTIGSHEIDTIMTILSGDTNGTQTWDRYAEFAKRGLPTYKNRKCQIKMHITIALRCLRNYFIDLHSARTIVRVVSPKTLLSQH